jgi:hypothetical protein
MSCSGNAIAAENETARPESRKYRASCRARHTVRRLEPRKNSTALDAQELTPRVRIPRRRTGVQGGVVSRNWRNNFHHKRRYGPAQAVLGTPVRRAKARSIFPSRTAERTKCKCVIDLAPPSAATWSRLVSRKLPMHWPWSARVAITARLNAPLCRLSPRSAEARRAIYIAAPPARGTQGRNLDGAKVEKTTA